MFLNEFDATMQHIQGKWKIMILYELHEQGVVRFNQLQRYIDAISSKTLTNQLKELEEMGVITRVVFPVVPPHVEYSLTAKGESLIPVLDLICEWGLAQVEPQLLDRTLCQE
ncbi:winged helix-turn-helix transcriptional regulator [Brochothrix campestris]|uniref:HTH-type transcriptional regulator n=1 Tax=Brochothrix campestris FSL F6-1037 TaxID=1265861 RepID=W7CZA0_9LIST|nr:helix-turn-helix domain-containing protein [Brochothrix campestris]EUJ42100.1 HTH-type transcriptional regulator [Brochothrix campestris FSL F6-1037]